MCCFCTPATPLSELFITESIPVAHTVYSLQPFMHVKYHLALLYDNGEICIQRAIFTMWEKIATCSDGKVLQVMYRQCANL